MMQTTSPHVFRQEGRYRPHDPDAVVARMLEHLGLERLDELAAYMTRMRQQVGTVARSRTITPAGVSNWKLKGRKGIPPEVIIDFMEWEGVSYDWLLWGEGPKYRKDALEQAERAGHTFDLRTIRVMLEAQQSPELVRAIEAALHDQRLRKILERLPRLSPSQVELIEKVVEL